MKHLLISVVMMALCTSISFAMSIPERAGTEGGTILSDIQMPRNYSNTILLRLSNGQRITATVPPSEQVKLRNARVKTGDTMTLISTPKRVGR